VFGNRVIRKILTPNKDEVSEQFKIYNEKLGDLYRPLFSYYETEIRKLQLAGHCGDKECI
jgi:hypothetical protein